MNSRSTIVIELPEQVSAKQARAVIRQVKPALRMDEPCVVVDLSRVRSLDLAGLDVLLQCMTQVANRDGSLRLAGVSPQAATILELTRMDRVFDLFPSVSEAVASVEVPEYEPLPSDVAQQPAAA
jgi:anti-anti-sigma factor